MQQFENVTWATTNAQNMRDLGVDGWINRLALGCCVSNLYPNLPKCEIRKSLTNLQYFSRSLPSSSFYNYRWIKNLQSGQIIQEFARIQAVTIL